MSRSKILVTGGAGFIGSHTVAELHHAGYKPVIIDNFSNSQRFIIDRINTACGEKIEVIEADCTHYDSMRKAIEQTKPAAVIHFAAYKSVNESVEKPLEYYHNNFNSLTVLLHLMQAYGINNLVFSSSCTVYGSPCEIPVRESTPLNKPESPYGYTKLMCEQLLFDLAKSNTNIKSVLLRYFNPVGAHPGGLIGEVPMGVPNNLIPYITQTAAGIRKELTVNGNDYNTPDGSCIRDYIHVVDLAKAHVASLGFLQQTNNKAEVFNLGTGKGHSVLECIKLFEEANDIKIPYKIGPRRKGDIERIWADTTKANKLLNWKTTYTLKDALQHAWKWQQQISNFITDEDEI